MTKFLNLEKNSNKCLTKTDFIIGSFISVVLLIIWALGSSGMSLIATFVPGILFAWILFAILYFRKIKPPDHNLFLPIYFFTLGWQFIHFSEEFATNFKEVFPQIYGGKAYAENTFVAFNMFSYFVFIVSPVLVYFRGLRFFLVPVLFFVVYGAIGNAIAHTWWSIYFGQYFSGLYTSFLYWLLGPILLATFLKSKKNAGIYIGIFLIALVVILTALIQHLS